MKGWETIKSITTKIGSGSTPRGGKGNYKNAGITLIRSLNIYNFEFSYKDLAFIDDSQAKKLNGVKVEEQDILLNITGASVGRCAMVPAKILPARVNQHVSIIRADKTKVDPTFLLYCINSPFYKGQLLSISDNGATREALTKEDIEKLQIDLPPLPRQKIIGDILKQYDLLIQVNSDRINLLQKKAELLFKEWFIRMRFPDHRKAKFKKGIPVDWTLAPIGTVIDYNIGGGWGNDIKTKKFDSPGFVIRGTDIPGIRAGEANFQVLRYHKQTNLKSRELKQGDIIFETAGGSEGQPLGRTCYITRQLLKNYGGKVIPASFCKLIRSTSIPQLYLYYFLNYLYDTGMIEAYQVQSTGISNYQFDPFLKFQEIILPTRDLMWRFHKEIDPIQEEIALLGQQSFQLRIIRDRLMPRLISGKIKVSSPKSIFEKV